MTYTSELIGRWGNQLFQYAAMRAEAERDGVPFVTPRWVGDEIFDLPKHEPTGEVRTLGGYRQDQDSLIYTRTQARGWFRLKPEIERQLAGIRTGGALAHHRAGDYLDLGYPVVARSSYVAALAGLGYAPQELEFVSEESPMQIAGLPEWLPDFYRLMKANILLRGNSSFSWWAATLSDAEVYSPVVDGLGAGVHDAEFVRGNHPRFCSLHFVTDLHLSE